ncbi:MAG TPA: class I SAM-dependent methyltransferase [Herpetosiphonaceae bacterium]|nr:class I SAM-dependent methyltransferase [Herpetosiphonaceae bacterium]
MSLEAIRLPDLENAARTMPFDQFGRYHALREAVDACRNVLCDAPLSILEVGGYFRTMEGEETLPIVQFLPRDRVTVLDVIDSTLEGYVQGDGAALTFGDEEFDLVISSDTFEHIPRPKRERFWQELLRVARHGVILAAPFGTPAVEAAEEILALYINAELHEEQQQLKEHREYRLPVIEAWLEHLSRQNINTRAYPIAYLHSWLGMMLIKHLLLRLAPGPQAQHLVDSYYNHYFFPTERRLPTYRYLVVAEKTTGLLAAVDAAIAPTIMPPQPDVSAGWGAALLPAVLAIGQRQLGRQEEQARQQMQQLQQTLATLDATLHHARLKAEQDAAAIKDLTERAQWLDAQASSLRAELRAVSNGLVMRLLQRFRRRG